MNNKLNISFSLKVESVEATLDFLKSIGNYPSEKTKYEVISEFIRYVDIVYNEYKIIKDCKKYTLQKNIE